MQTYYHFVVVALALTACVGLTPAIAKERDARACIEAPLEKLDRVIKKCRAVARVAHSLPSDYTLEQVSEINYRIGLIAERDNPIGDRRIYGDSAAFHYLESMKAERLVQPPNEDRLALRYFVAVRRLVSNWEFKDARVHFDALKPLAVRLSASDQTDFAEIVRAFDRFDAEEAAKLAAEEAENAKLIAQQEEQRKMKAAANAALLAKLAPMRKEFEQRIAQRAKGESTILQTLRPRVADPGFPVRNCGATIAKNGIASIDDLPPSIQAMVARVEPFRAYVCEATSGGLDIIRWREWACRGETSSRIELRECVIGHWRGGVPPTLLLEPSARTPEAMAARLFREAPFVQNTIQSFDNSLNAGPASIADMAPKAYWKMMPPYWQPD